MLVLFQRMLMHYRTGLFRALAGRTDLLVVHGLPPQIPGQYGGAISDPDRDFGFRRLMVKNHWWQGEKLVWQDFLPAFGGKIRPKVVVVEESPRIASNFALIALCKARAIPTLGFGHGRSMQRSLSEGGIANRVRRAQIGLMNGYIAYGAGGRDEVLPILGAERVFVAQNTLDTDELEQARRFAEREPLAAIKQRLGLRSKHILLFSGRLHADKEPATVIRLAQRLRAQGRDVGVVFLGQGPQLGELKALVEAPLEVHFLGENNELAATAPYFVAADAMVMPRWLGLAINHALSMGLPVLTQEPAPGRPPHPPEVDALEQGVTGYIVPSDDLDAMAAAAVEIFENRETFRSRAIRKIECDLSLSRWVDGFAGAVETVACRMGRY